MAKKFEKIEAAHRAFILKQKLFFTATAAPSGRVNLSPKGLDTFRLINERSAAWLDLTGSGNETAAHLQQDDRLTLMFCAFEGAPLILRLYGRGKVIVRGSALYKAVVDSHFAGAEPLGARQAVQLDIDLVQTSCGYGIPLYAYQSDRDTLQRWAAAKGQEGLVAYRAEYNRHSIDGFETGFIEGAETEVPIQTR